MNTRLYMYIYKIARHVGFLKRLQCFKTAHEMDYWLKRHQLEGVLANSHYEFFFTEHFSIGKSFYREKKLLDIGCGPRGSLEWADMTEERVGLDPLADHYRVLGTAVHKMTYMAAPSEKIPFPDSYFDVVSSFNSLDHVNDLDRTVGEIKRILKPGGYFLLLTELGHEPTECEPIVFSFDIVKKFMPELELVDEKHYERSNNGIYDSIIAGVSYNHADSSARLGILSAKFIKPLSG